MNTKKHIVSLILLVAALLATGCNGPTKAGKEARADAAERMNIVNAQLNYDQAKQAFEVGRFERALKEVNVAIARRADYAPYHLLKGRIQMETHKLEEAMTSFKAAIEHDAKLSEAHYFAGIVFQRWSDDEQAYESYSKALELEPTKVQYVLASAESLIAMGELDAAQSLITERSASFEHNAALRELEGQIAQLQNDYPRAVQLYGEARLLNPDDLGLLESLAWAQYGAGMYGQCFESIRLLQQQLKEPRTDLTHVQARCLVHMERPQEARNVYMELTRSMPANPEVWSELGVLSWELGDWTRVARSAQELISLVPNRFEGYMLKGLNERRKGNTAEAIELFRSAADLSTESAMPHLLLGQLLEQSGNINGAMQAYADGLNVQPDSREARALHDQLARSTSSSAVTVVPN